MNPRRPIQEIIHCKERLERGKVTPARVTEITLADGGRYLRRELNPKAWQRRQTVTQMKAWRKQG